MVWAYHRDLRERAVRMMVEESRPKKEVAAILHLGMATVYRWHHDWLEEKRVEARQGFQRGHSHKVIDLEEFKQFLEANPGRNQEELGQLWKTPCGPSTMQRAIQKINYSYKKNAPVSGAG
jgi:transposase